MDPQNAPMTFRQYYFDENNEPKANVRFKRNRIWTNQGTPNEPNLWHDITKLEMRMFFLYQAMAQIDMGYRALHMGIYWGYAKYDVNPTFGRLGKLLDTIRKYAEDKGTFVLLSGENPVGITSFKRENGMFLFDVDSRAMRPREISDPQVSGDYHSAPTPCTQPIEFGAAMLFQDAGSPCLSEPYPAVVDPCVIGNNHSGTSPRECSLERNPYFVHWDGYTGKNLTFPNPTNGVNSLTFGLDDCCWFSQLQPNCKQAWFNHFYCERVNMSNRTGFLTAPGILPLSSSYFNLGTSNNFEGGRWLFTDNPGFVESIKQLWTPKVPTINHTVKTTSECRYEKCVNKCNNEVAPLYFKYAIGSKEFEIVVEVGNIDCSSIYSIHVKAPDGSWLPTVWGTSTDFIPTMDGDYEVFVRQDNLGLHKPDDINWGTEQFSKTINVSRTCCKQMLANKCNIIYGSYSERTINSTIYPNPADKEIVINIEMEKPEEYEGIRFELINSVAKTVIEGKIDPNSSQTSISTSTFPDGIYILKLSSPQYTETKIISINHQE